MKDTTPSNSCPKCGGLIPAAASQGICPKCALAAVATATEAGQPAGERRSPPALEAVAAAFPQLEILELIGAGGMGAVFKVCQPKLERFVALKLLSQPLAGDCAFAERFHREARVLARLNHPGIVSVYDYGEAGAFFYLLMEFVDGVNLRQAMRAGRFTPAQALALVPKICEALQFAHDEGILHRDIKPENILLDTRGRVKIADFGIAKLIGDKATVATLTGSGLAVGTPHYMAPEQLEHPQDVDQRADIYSLGVVFYEMLTGELPIGRFAPPSQKTPMDPRVDDVVLRALEKERERRQHNVTEVKTELDQIAATPVAPAKAPGLELPAAASAAAPKTSLCYISTPEYQRTFRGRFLYIYQGNGHLRLDEKTLSFTSGWQVVTIPLASIRSLALGEYSLAAKPIPLHYLEVTFEERGASRTLLFTPTSSALLPVWETNKIVAEWLSALQEAVRAATGQKLALNRAAPQGRGYGELLKAFGFTAVLCALAFAIIPVIAAHRLPNRWTDYLAGPLVAALTLGILLTLRAWLERRALLKGNLDELIGLPGSSETPVFMRGNDTPDVHHFHRPLWWTLAGVGVLVFGCLAALQNVGEYYFSANNPPLDPLVMFVVAGMAMLGRRKAWRLIGLAALALGAGVMFWTILFGQAVVVGAGLRLVLLAVPFNWLCSRTARQVFRANASASPVGARTLRSP